MEKLEKQIEDSDPLGLDTYGYPKVDLDGKEVRISLGWFFIGLSEDEAATYLDVYVDDKGKETVILCDYGSGFRYDFRTKLRDFGFWRRFDGCKPYFVYADHHVRRRDRLKWWLNNLPFWIKKAVHYWCLDHLPKYRSFCYWRRDRQMRRLFK